MSEMQNLKDHGAPLIPGEIRTHTVGNKTFKIMHTGNGAFTQATVRTAGVLTTEVLATERFESAALRIYATAIERAEAATPPQSSGWTSHGHAMRGVPQIGARPDMVARCGGPGMCQACGREEVAASTPAPTLADDVAALRDMIADLVAAADAGPMLAALARIAGAVPQRARATERESWWLHSCGYVELYPDSYGTPVASTCTKCDEVGPWRALYTPGGE